MSIPLSLLLPLCAPDLFLGLSTNTAELSEGMRSYLLDATISIPISGVNPKIRWLFWGLAGLYFAGVLFFAVWIAYGYIGMMRLVIFGRKIGTVSPTHGREVEKLAFDLLMKNKQLIGVRRKVYVILHPDNPTPFSWLNYIIIGETDLIESGTEILRHELSHIQKRHTLDVMLADLLLIYQWFNPAAWLLKRSLQQVHEFQADEAVLRSGVNAKHYQLLLVKKAVGQRLFAMANNFNYSKLKNRIAMMLKEESSKWAYAKYLYIFPLVFAFVSAYASEPVAFRINQIENSFVFGLDTLVSADTVSLKSQVVGSANPEYVLDGEIIGIKEFNQIDKNTIQQVVACKAILPPGTKNGNAPKAFRDLIASILGHEKKDVVVKAPKNEAGVVLLDGTQMILGERIKISGTVRLSVAETNENPPLIIYDGKELASMQAINPDEIEAITVLKDKSALTLYGEKGKNGVILIVSKEKQMDKEKK